MSAFFDEVYARYGKPGEFVKQARAKMALHKISRGRLATRSGFPAPRISEWLNGRVAPSLATMLVLDETLETIIEEG